MGGFFGVIYALASFDCDREASAGVLNLKKDLGEFCGELSLPKKIT